MIGHIYIYGEIENYQGNNASEFGVCSLKSVVDSFNAQKDCTELVVHIHSPGGDVIEGLAIYDFLKGCGKKVTTRVEGLCASIATIPLLAGSERQATDNSIIFIHNAWTMAVGDANALEETSKDLRKYTEIIKSIYVEETLMREDQLTPLMDKETSLNLSEAIEYGFINNKVNQLKAVAKLNKNKNKSMEFNLESIKDFITGKSTKEEVKNVALTLVDGTVVESSSEEAEPKVGDVLKNEEGENVADGVHELESGYKVTTEAGVVTEVEKVEEVEEVVEESEEVIALREEVATLKESLKNLADESKEVKATLLEATSVIKNLRNSVTVEPNTDEIEKEEKASYGIRRKNK